ncbi:MAG: hypothetical protein IKV32_07095 [Muribaculaceae bacterium]|nr:hypothetical protein [Muribaculaceae bacterium]
MWLKENKLTLLWAILSVLLIVYMVVAFTYTTRRAQESLCKGVDIVVHDQGGLEFVTVDDISHEIQNENGQFLTKKVGEINTHKIETQLNAIDKIERANCVFFNNSRLRIDVMPLVPVARIFDDKGSYYINREGKKMIADPRYRVDVPIVVGNFDKQFPAVSILPLLSYITNDSTWNSLVSSVKISPRNRDIIIVPMIKGHVINFGDTTMIENKFARIKTMYKEVLPVKGWNFYDTISVKWRGQVVATRYKKNKRNNTATFADSIDYEAVDEATMGGSIHAYSYNVSSTNNEVENKNKQNN